jgi:hypothetical protein
MRVEDLSGARVMAYSEPGAHATPILQRAAASFIIEWVGPPALQVLTARGAAYDDSTPYFLNHRAICLQASSAASLR